MRRFKTTIPFRREGPADLGDDLCGDALLENRLYSQAIASESRE
jgi:hypothetical protein